MMLGLHCDVRRGYPAALRRAEELGCEAMQMLTYRRHHEPGEAEFAEFREAFAASSVGRLILHVRYLPALASEDAERRKRSAAHFAREMRLARFLGGECLVFHLGAYSPGSSAKRGMEFFLDGTLRALEAAGDGVPLVLENVPGGGRRMGGSLEELAEMGERFAKAGVETSYCLDTAHAWAYGYDMDTQEGMLRFLARTHRLLDAAKVRVFHLNDSRAPHGSNRENHWHWGEGFLGPEGARTLLARTEYADAAGILEMPPGRDAESLAYVRGLAFA